MGMHQGQLKKYLSCKKSLRNAVLNIMEIIQQNNDDQTKLIETKIRSIAKNLPCPAKAIGILMQFSQHLKKDVQLRSKLSIILNGNVTCEFAESGVKQILKHFGNPVESNQYYMLLKQLLERIVPIMLDKEGLKFLVSFVEDSEFSGTIDAELNIKKSTRKALDLILIMSYAFPQYFCDDYIYSTFLKLLHSEDDIVAEKTLKIFCNITNEPGLDKNQMCNTLNHHMLRFIESGTPKQVKHALYCLAHVVKNREEVFGNILHKLKRHFTLESPHFRAALVAVGHIAYMCQNMFACELKTIVAKVVVKDLLMLEKLVRYIHFSNLIIYNWIAKSDSKKSNWETENKNLPYKGNELWVPFDSLPNETKVKLEGMKVMVRWLLSLKDVMKPAMSTFRLLNTIIEQRGDLMERGHNAPMENSWMRVTAAGCLLRLCREPNYSESLTLQQFQRLAYVITDECFEVRNIFVEKLNKGLHFMKLPLEFLAIYALGGLEPDAILKDNIKNNLANNEPLHLPDYALQYAVHLLAHAPFLREYNNVPSLLKVQKCLSFFLEPLILKNIGYSFSFFKRLLEDIKQTKDKQDPENTEVNLKLYAVSDLALNILMSQHKLILKDFPARPKLNPRFSLIQTHNYCCSCHLCRSFTNNYSNLETYLPAKLLNLKSLQKAGFDIQVFNAAENEPSTSTMNKKTKATSKNSKASVKKLLPEKNTKYSMTYQSNSEPETNSLHSASDLSDVESSVDSGNEEYPSSVRTRSRNNKTIKQKKVPSLKKKQLSKSPSIKRSSKNNYLSYKRSKKLSPDSNLTKHDDNLSSSASIISVDASCPSNYQHLIKECTVELDKIELKEHTFKVLNVAKNHLVSNKRKQSDFKSEDDLSDQDSSSNIHNGKLTKKGRSNKKNSSLQSLDKKAKQSTSKDEENNNVPKLPAKSVKKVAKRSKEKQTTESPKRTLR
ncbi:sister chromatid cohesion protein PDS5 homolog B [Caerostris extrusa]|uniref:Sister chromatid cohesion protein PDS5 homolog B n=1 Tax=Caerostris extrusa TaxID=172846 RepID=A0AAV4Y5H2_CAEEX|nr:sister chromatid cohesion protein PDS5 homolog B [Caerostris extrusa]